MKKVSTEQKLKESQGMIHEAVLRKSITGRGNSQCKRPEVRICLVCEVASGARDRVREGSSRWGQCVYSCVICVHVCACTSVVFGM